MTQHPHIAVVLKRRAIRSLGSIKSPHAEAALTDLLKEYVDSIAKIETEIPHRYASSANELSLYDLCRSTMLSLRDHTHAGPLAVLKKNYFDKVSQQTLRFQSTEWKHICQQHFQRGSQYLFGDQQEPVQVATGISQSDLLCKLAMNPTKELLAHLTATSEGRTMLRTALRSGDLFGDQILPLLTELYVDTTLSPTERKALTRLIRFTYHYVEGAFLFEHIQDRHPKVAHLAQAVTLSRLVSRKLSWDQKKEWLSSIFPACKDVLLGAHTTDRIRILMTAMFGHQHHCNKTFPGKLAHCIAKLYVSEELSSEDRSHMVHVLTSLGDPSVVPCIKDALRNTADPERRLCYLSTAAMLGDMESALRYLQQPSADTQSSLVAMFQQLYNVEPAKKHDLFVVPHTIFHPRILVDIASPTAYASLLSVFETSRAHLEFNVEHHGFSQRLKASLLNPPEGTPQKIAQRGIAYAEALDACEELGIKAPFRFSAATLQRLVAERKRLHEQGNDLEKTAILFAASRYADHNGALYDLEPITNDLMAHGYRVLYFEAYATQAMRELVALKKRYQLEPDVLVLAAHGTRHGLLMTHGKRSSNRIGAVALYLTSGLSDFVKPEGAVVLCSCEAAYGLGGSDLITAVESTLASQCIVVANSRVGPVPERLVYNDQKFVTGALSNGRQVFYVTDRTQPKKQLSAEARLLKAIFQR